MILGVGDFDASLGSVGAVQTRGSGLESCLTILSEERETWAADSLRGLVVGLGFGVS
jgi:hypothetical protein